MKVGVYIILVHNAYILKYQHLNKVMIVVLKFRMLNKFAELRIPLSFLLLFVLLCLLLVISDSDSVVWLTYTCLLKAV